MKPQFFSLLVFLGGCSYGILSTIVKLAYRAGLTPAEICGGQVFFGCLLLWLAAVRYIPHLLRMRLRRILTLIVAGIPVGATTLLYYHALRSLSASFAVILLFQYVWITMIFDTVLSRHLPGWGKVLALFVILTGSALATGVVFEGRTITLGMGLVFGCASALSYALVLLSSGTVGVEVPPILKSALLSLGALAITFLLVPPHFLFDGAMLLETLPYGVPLGVFGILLPPLLFSIGIPHTGQGLAGILTASELPVAMFSAFFVLGEHVSPLRWLGVVLIFAGIVLGNLPHGIKPSKKQH